eukprot:365069-Chlamydomonas_euryale.AAC.20
MRCSCRRRLEVQACGRTEPAMCGGLDWDWGCGRRCLQLLGTWAYRDPPAAAWHLGVPGSTCSCLAPGRTWIHHGFSLQGAVAAAAADQDGQVQAGAPRPRHQLTCVLARPRAWAVTVHLCAGPQAWLNPRELPTAAQLACGLSGRRMDFLLQVYAPPPECFGDAPCAFHRAVFVFVSPEGGRLDMPGAVVALRCQLPRENAYYAGEPAPASQRAPAPLPPDTEPPEGRDPWQVAAAEAGSSGRGGGSSRGVGSRRGRQQGRRGGGGGGGGGAAGSAAAEEGPRLFPELELLVEAEADVLEGAPEDPQVARLVAAYEAHVAEHGDVGEDECPADVVNQVWCGARGGRG